MQFHHRPLLMSLRSAILQLIFLSGMMTGIAPAPQSAAAVEFAERATQLRINALQRVSLDVSKAQGRVLPPPAPRYGWKRSIVTSVFFIGDRRDRDGSSAWDPKWQRHYGGFDDPNPKHRSLFTPSAFIPRLNPFYVALPYNDIIDGRTKPEARMIPWFRFTFHKEGVSVCKDRWVAIRKGTRIAYAQWSDCGPFRSDHWQYVFGAERPKPNPQGGAGLSISPAVRDYLSLSSMDLTDWKFAEVRDVPRGPWADFGANNPLARAK